MNPHSKPRPLFFTPRSPWGRLPLKRTAQNHMRASQDIQPAPTQNYRGEAMDEQQKLEEQKRRMDTNNVPRSLKPTGERPERATMHTTGAPFSVTSQISPQRAGEITDPSRKPLPSPQIPRETNKAFPLDPKQQPQPPLQVFPQTAGAGKGDPAQTRQGELIQNPGWADKAMETQPQKIPFQDYFNGVPLPGGATLGIDSFGNGGGTFKVTLPVWQDSQKKSTPSR